MSREVHVQFWERVGVKFRQRGSPRGANTIFEQSYATAWAAIRKRGHSWSDTGHPADARYSLLADAFQPFLIVTRNTSSPNDW